MYGSSSLATSDIWTNDVLDMTEASRASNTPILVRSSRCGSFIFWTARAVPPRTMGITQANSISVGSSPNQSQLIMKTTMTPVIRDNAVFIPTGRNFSDQSDNMRLVAPVNPENINFGRKSGSSEKLLGLASNKRGDMEIIREIFLTVATDSPSCLRTWWAMRVPYMEYPSIASTAREKKVISSKF